MEMKFLYAVNDANTEEVHVLCETLADAEEYILAWSEATLYDSCHWDLHYWDLTETMEENIANLYEYIQEAFGTKNFLTYTASDLAIERIAVY